MSDRDSFLDYEEMEEEVSGCPEYERLRLEVERLTISVDIWKASADMWRKRCYEMGVTSPIIGGCDAQQTGAYTND